ncbi:unnamed protein product [Pieris brassicae]|uniref:Uncharacterized protein n=1 Tax=Pieris brassicae TaxID=7116 RepID=A0A9P0TLL3_PIEBR|nr:unnamed protein product [Pieris brassicae]
MRAHPDANPAEGNWKTLAQWIQTRTRGRLAPRRGRSRHPDFGFPWKKHRVAHYDYERGRRGATLVVARLHYRLPAQEPRDCRAAHPATQRRPPPRPAAAASIHSLRLQLFIRARRMTSRSAPPRERAPRAEAGRAPIAAQQHAHRTPSTPRALATVGQFTHAETQR